jgi:hypothetical protein
MSFLLHTIRNKKLKYFFYISFLLFNLFISSCSGPRTEEELAEEVFQAFLDDNQQAFKQLYVNKNDIHNIINDSDIPDHMKNNAKKTLKSKTAFWKIISKIGFRSMRFKAFENGVNWQDAEIISIEQTESNFDYFNFDHAFNKKYGIEVKDILIVFVSNKDTFTMKLNDCIYTKSRGWCLSEDVRIHRKSIYSNF